MKKIPASLVMLLAGAFVAHSQGLVTFSNYGMDSMPGFAGYSYVTLSGVKIGGKSGAPVGNPYANIAYGDDWTVELYGAAGANGPASSLQPLIDGSIANNTTVPVTAPLADAVTDPMPGTWYSGDSGIVPGAFATQTATVQVYAWYNDGGTISSYDAAVAAGVPSGFSATATVIYLGGPSAGNASPPLPPPLLPTGAKGLGNIQVGILIPEPGTISLAVLGASAFILRLKQKTPCPIKR
jgi:hypothetical protein